MHPSAPVCHGMVQLPGNNMQGKNFVAVKSDGVMTPWGGDLRAMEKGQPQPTLLLALVETFSASLEYSPNGYANTRSS
jgi:hypothetical protein